MFFRNFMKQNRTVAQATESVFVGMEGLEGRRMLSAAPVAHHAPKPKHHKAPPAVHASATTTTTSATTSSATSSTTTTKAPPPPAKGPAPAPQTILFSAAPAVVQAGLQKIAPSGVTIDPGASVNVCKRPDGSTIYVTEVSSNGNDVYLSVDANGNAVPPPPPPPPPAGTQPVHPAPTTILFSAAPAVVQAGLAKLAPAGTTIDPSEDVTVCTRPDGTKVYTTEVSVSGKDVYFSVDANGNPVPPPPPPPPGAPKAS